MIRWCLCELTHNLENSFEIVCKKKLTVNVNVKAKLDVNPYKQILEDMKEKNSMLRKEKIITSHWFFCDSNDNQRRIQNRINPFDWKPLTNFVNSNIVFNRVLNTPLLFQHRMNSTLVVSNVDARLLTTLLKKIQ